MTNHLNTRPSICHAPPGGSALTFNILPAALLKKFILFESRLAASLFRGFSALRNMMTSAGTNYTT